MKNLPKWMYWLIFACVVAVVIGVMVSRVIRSQAFEVEDAVLLLTSVVGFIFKTDRGFSSDSAEDREFCSKNENDESADEHDTTVSHFDDDEE